MDAGGAARAPQYVSIYDYIYVPNDRLGEVAAPPRVEAPFNGDYNDAATTALAASSTTTVATRDGRPDGPQLHLIVNDPT